MLWGAEVFFLIGIKIPKFILLVFIVSIIIKLWERILEIRVLWGRVRVGSWGARTFLGPQHVNRCVCVCVFVFSVSQRELNLTIIIKIKERINK